MGWYSILPSHLTTYETWIIRVFVRLNFLPLFYHVSSPFRRCPLVTVIYCADSSAVTAHPRNHKPGPLDPGHPLRSRLLHLPPDMA